MYVCVLKHTIFFALSFFSQKCQRYFDKYQSHAPADLRFDTKTGIIAVVGAGNSNWNVTVVQGHDQVRIDFYVGTCKL